MREGELNQYKKRLENAINAALADSPHITRAIEEIREQGFDVFLIVEATIGFNRRDDDDTERTTTHQTVELELTTQDANFLRKFGIRPD